MSQSRLQRGLSVPLGLLLAVGISVSLSNHYTDPTYSKTRGWRELAAAFERFSAGLSAEDVRLVQNFPDPTIWYYYSGPVEHLVLPPQPNDVEGAGAAVTALAEADVQRLILPLQPAAWWDGSNIAPSVLAETYALVAETQVGVWPVQIYSRSPEELEPLQISFANGLVLAGAAVEPDELVPGGLLTIHLAWDSASALRSGSETVFVHLLDDAQIVAQTDRLLALPSDPEQQASYGILLPEVLPTASYRLLVGLYDPDQDGAPRLLTEDGRDAVELTTWMVAQ